jgi:hypothetical protein
VFKRLVWIPRKKEKSQANNYSQREKPTLPRPMDQVTLVLDWMELGMVEARFALSSRFTAVSISRLHIFIPHRARNGLPGPAVSILLRPQQLFQGPLMIGQLCCLASRLDADQHITRTIIVMEMHQ